MGNGFTATATGREAKQPDAAVPLIKYVPDTLIAEAVVTAVVLAALELPIVDTFPLEVALETLVFVANDEVEFEASYVSGQDFVSIPDTTVGQTSKSFLPRGKSSTIFEIKGGHVFSLTCVNN